MDSFYIPEQVKPPREAYRYWPTGNLVYDGDSKNLIRFFFYRVEFTPYELEKLGNFKDDIKKLLKGDALPEFYSDQELIRVLVGCKFDRKKAAKALLTAIAWRGENMRDSYMTLYPKCMHLLVRIT
jgi:hypothetical protein